MRELDDQAYALLREANPCQVLIPEEQLGWYDFSYAIFTKQPLQKMEDHNDGLFWYVLFYYIES